MAYGQRNFGGGNRRGGNSYGGGRGGFGGGGRGGFNKPSFAVRCDDCGTNTTVPFKPNGSKPVLCRDCFRGGDSKPSYGGHDRSYGGHDRRDDRAPRRSSGPAPVGPSLKSEIQSMNEKLDQILSILGDLDVEVEEPEESNEEVSFE